MTDSSENYWLKDILHFHSLLGERKIMNHFVVFAVDMSDSISLEP
jgi:hypothetical protein